MVCIIQFSKCLDILGSLATIFIRNGLLYMLPIPWLPRGVNELLVYYDWVGFPGGGGEVGVGRKAG